jgi:ribosomal protein S18 acetylase RimI-like enzyme
MAVAPKISIVSLDSSKGTVAALSALMVEVVADGGSVGFLHPLAKETAAAFWTAALDAAMHNDRIVLGAFHGETLVATATLMLAFPANQPHRAEIAKMMTRPGHRGQGIASALLREAERLAIERRRTLLVLDTAVEEGAGGFYEKMSFNRVGEIPNFALKPHGGLTGTAIYWKRPAEYP